MSRPPALADALVDRLRATLTPAGDRLATADAVDAPTGDGPAAGPGSAAAAPSIGPAAGSSGATPSVAGRWSASARAAVRRALSPAAARLSRRSRSAAARVARRAGRRALAVVVRVDAASGDVLAERAAALALARTEALVGEAARHEEALARIEALKADVFRIADGVGVLTAASATVGDVATRNAVNGELVKAELRVVSEQLDEIGWAVAPGAGPAALATRFAELRERVNEVDRRVRAALSTSTASATAAKSTPTDSSSTGTGSAAVGGADADELEAGSSGFDYTGLELRFRGDPAEISRTLLERYGDVLAANAPVLDVGCGRGELLAALAERGVAVTGVDLDGGMVAEARARGVDAVEGDLVEHLRGCTPGSLGSIVCIHVVEHLPLGRLVAFLELAASRLVPGGLLIAETPNPASLIVLGNSFILDPTHVWPLHPSLLTFLCERAGFRDVRLRFESPATSYRLPALNLDQAAPPWAHQIDESLQRLNEVLFGPQEYAVLARTPDSGAD